MKPEMERRNARTDAVLAYLTERPLAWVLAQKLVEIGGAFAWRTRISEARQRLERDGKGTIAWNEQPRASAYRFVPYVPLGRDAGTVIAQPVLIDVAPRG